MSPKPRSFRKPAARDMRVVRKATAADAIGPLGHGTDTYILTYGQFSLIDALAAILDQTGPADVVVSSWTAADAHLEHAQSMIEAMSIRRFRMIVDRSFQSRQPGYHAHMRRLFGEDCIRAIRSHAKFMLVTNERWAVVVRTSMNLNENPRFENIEVSEDRAFADFMLAVVDDIFQTVPAGTNASAEPEIAEHNPFRLIESTPLDYEAIHVPTTTHVA